MNMSQRLPLWLVAYERSATNFCRTYTRDDLFEPIGMRDELGVGGVVEQVEHGSFGKTQL